MLRYFFTLLNIQWVGTERSIYHSSLGFLFFLVYQFRIISNDRNFSKKFNDLITIATKIIWWELSAPRVNFSFCKMIQELLPGAILVDRFW